MILVADWYCGSVQVRYYGEICLPKWDALHQVSIGLGDLHEGKAFIEGSQIRVMKRVGWILPSMPCHQVPPFSYGREMDMYSRRGRGYSHYGRNVEAQIRKGLLPETRSQKQTKFSKRLP